MVVKPEALVHATFKFFKRTGPGPCTAGWALSLPRLPAFPSHLVWAAAENARQKIEASGPARGGRGCDVARLKVGAPQTEPWGIS